MRKEKVIKKLTPKMAFDTVFKFDGNRPYRKDVLRDQLGNMIVDTMKASDTGLWETAISRDDQRTWIIVEQYKNREDAKKGHIEWWKDMMEHPDRELKDIYTG